MSALWYTRDASFWPRSKARSEPTRLHLNDGTGMALCSRRIMLITEDEEQSAGVENPGSRRCMRCTRQLP